MALTSHQILPFLLILTALISALSTIYRNDYNPLFLLGLYTVISLKSAKYSIGLTIVILIITAILDSIWLVFTKPTFN